MDSRSKDDIDDLGGYVTLEVIRDGKHGPEVIHSETRHNLIVNTGKRQLWRRASGLNTSVFKFLRIGIGSTAAASGDTNVKTAITGTLKTADSFTLLSGTRTMQWIISYPSGVGTKSASSIVEVVLLNQHTSPGGSALMRTVFTSVNKTTADKLRITYKSRIT